MPISKPEDLVTPREKTRAGFISMALEKGYMAQPYIDTARALKTLASKVSNPQELIDIPDLRVGLLSASGLSDKALNYLNDDDKNIAIKGLIDEFLIPANKDFPDELVYRYLLTKGDSLGGQSRNLAGVLGERKFLRGMLSIFSLSGTNYKYLDSASDKWLDKPETEVHLEKSICGFSWNQGNGERVLLLNIKVPIVNKGVDLTIFNCNLNQLVVGKARMFPELYIALGELKGGIDPAGADEHWKTASKALTRIRESFDAVSLKPKTFFIGAAIENSMSNEIFQEMQTGHLSMAANLTKDDQLTEICQWVVNI